MKKDILITAQGETTILVTAQTKEAKKIFTEIKCEDGFEGEMSKTNLKNILAWAVSHNLSIDTKIPIIIPSLPVLTRKELEKMYPNVPRLFLPQKLFAIGKSKFKGDVFTTEETKNWSVNDKFTKGEEYPVFDNEGLFVVGNDGKSYKMTPKAWTKITSY